MVPFPVTLLLTGPLRARDLHAFDLALLMSMMTVDSSPVGVQAFRGHGWGRRACI